MAKRVTGVWIPCTFSDVVVYLSKTIMLAACFFP
jgi:hypothetical protein